jgi:hypothetical protein
MEGKPDGVRCRSAGARHRKGWAAQTASHRYLARRRVDHQLGNGQRKDARFLLDIDAAEALIVGGLAADAGAQNGRGAHRQRHVEDEARLRDRLAGGDHRELRDAVERGELPFGKVRERIEVLHFGSDFLSQLLIRRRERNRAEPAHARFQLLPVGRDGVAERRDRAEAGDDNTIHVDHDFFCATRSSTALTTSPTVSNSVRGLLVLAL